MTDDFGFTETIEELCDKMVKGMSRKELEIMAWDRLYEDLQDMSMEDIIATAEYFEVDA